MGLQILNRAQAFGPGSQLWFISSMSMSDGEAAQPTPSPLISKINWYLNFQLTRAYHHKGLPLSSELKAIISEHGLPDFHKPVDSPHPLMLVAHEQFQTQAIIDVPINKKKMEWPTQIHQIWSNLGKPSLRIFLPSDFPADEFSTKFTAKWAQSDDVEMTLVPT